MKEPKKQSQPTEATAPEIDLVQLESLLALMRDHGLEEFEYSYRDLRIHLRKAAPFGSQGHVISVPTEMTSGGSQPIQPVAPASIPALAPIAPSEPAVAALPAEELHMIKSPIVGTFYGAPNPEAAPYVKVGDAVQVGQTICIIEAMKLMNEIEADVSGEIVRVLIENGQPVEYGEPLFEVRPAKKKK